MGTDKKKPIESDEDSKEMQTEVLNALKQFFDKHHFLRIKSLEGAFRQAQRREVCGFHEDILLQTLQDLASNIQKIINSLNDSKDEEDMEIEVEKEDEESQDEKEDIAEKGNNGTDNTNVVNSKEPEGSLGSKPEESQTVDKSSHEKSQSIMDADLVQVRAGKSEIERRIQAFIMRKQLEVNQDNCRDFCSIGTQDSDSGCARTSAVLTPRLDSKSHIKLTRVHNIYGPQTRPEESDESKQSENKGPPPDVKPRLVGPLGSEGTVSASLQQAADERLSNLEQHLGMHRDSTKDMFLRLRSLEDRVLQLESLSPEYFCYMPAPKRQRGEAGSGQDKHRKKTADPKQNLSIIDIEEKIHSLKKSLRGKQQQMMVTIKQEPPGDG